MNLYLRRKFAKTGLKYTKKEYDRLREINDKLYGYLPEKHTDKRIWFDPVDSRFRGLSANCFLPSVVTINGEWAYHILTSHSDELMNYLISTLGHEIGHKERIYRYPPYSKKISEFINAVNEVYADFYASNLIKGDVRSILINAAKHKLDYRNNNNCSPDKDTYNHPSWAHRIKYLSEYNFDSNLIREIAHDYNFDNTLIIDKLIRFYAPYFIYLE